MVENNDLKFSRPFIFYKSVFVSSDIRASFLFLPKDAAPSAREAWIAWKTGKEREDPPCKETLSVCLRSFLGMLEVEGRAGGGRGGAGSGRGGRAGGDDGGGGVAMPQGGRAAAEKLRFCFRWRGAALAPADPYTINIPRPRAPLTKPFCF